MTSIKTATAIVRSTVNPEVPAYIEVKFISKCHDCKKGINDPSYKIIKVGELAFWSKSLAKTWHRDCGDPEWKLPGTPYDKRINLAIAHKQKVITFEDRVKTALTRFKKDLEIANINLKLDADVFRYLKTNELIGENERGQYYTIVPKGANWDVDEERVIMPVSTEMVDTLKYNPETDEIERIKPLTKI